jgi:hypothetical protein
LICPPPRVRGYPVEAVIAEKYQAMVELDIRNSRMKDFFYLWAIALTMEVETSTRSQIFFRPFPLIPYRAEMAGATTPWRVCRWREPC